PYETETFGVPSGKIAIGTFPVLSWYSVAFSPDSIEDYYNSMTALFLAMFAVIALILVVLNIFVVRSAKEAMEVLATATRTNKSLKIKFSLVFLLFAILLFSLIAINSVRQIQQAASIMVSISGMPILERLSAVIDGDKYEALAQTLDEFDPFYQEMQEVFRQIKSETQCLYLYSMAYDADGVHRFIFDAEEPGSENYSPLGEIEDVSSYDRSYMQAYKTRTTQFTKMMTQLRWGRLISVYMPLFNSNEDVVGVIGVDFQGEDIYAAIMSSLKLQVVFAFIFIAIVFLSYFLILKDLTRQNEALFIMSREKENASQAKSDFLAKMSHEIRTPMNAILGIAQIQMQKGDLPEEYAGAFDKIYNSGNSLLKIINDILDLSKIESGKMELQPIEYGVPSLINDAVQLNVVRIGSKPIEFILDIDENLPSKFLGDELRLKQILNNLLSNAIKYTEKGYVKLSVKHFANGGDAMLHFSVEDTGQGLKPEDKERLFSEYLRFNAYANRSTEGTGIGLNITQNLVYRMDGTIEVESEYGHGSVFTVTVKQQTVDCAAIGAETAEKLRNFTFASERQLSKMQMSFVPMPYGKVLIVDDVETNLYVAKGLMSAYKLKIETADSGFAALGKVENGNVYDVIFIDHMMPQMDGIETTQKLRGMGYTGVIIALTANAIVGSDKMFKQNGFDDFISKPIDDRQLNACLNTYIRDRHPEEAENYKIETAQTTVGINPKLFAAFRRDAEKAVITMRDTIASGNIKLFTTTAHGMKSTLANVGKPDESELASALESAGLDGDMEFISANTENFLELLESLINKLKPTEAADGVDAEYDEDRAYLVEQLRVIELACGDYNDTAAYAALDRLQEMSWNPETSVMLENIRNTLYFDSDFEVAAKQAVELSGTRQVFAIRVS
ncbi:MAG: response regulator, partial [Acidobacteriota bacterium]|nr:response regulator [Acidobacteriota bacterium]